MAVLHFLSIINFVDYFIYRYSNMARLTRAWEYIPSKDWTQMELEDLKKIINKHDNVKNFSEEEKDSFWYFCGKYIWWVFSRKLE